MAEGRQENSPEGRHGSGDFGHVSVLLKEAIDFLAVRRGGTYVDATVGAGGHSFEIAKRLGAQGRLIGFDKDPAALEIARARLADAPAEQEQDWPAVELRQASFAEVASLRNASCDGVLADLGLSSLQLTNAADAGGGRLGADAHWYESQAERREAIAPGDPCGLLGPAASFHVA